MKIVFNKKIVDGPWGGGNQMLMMLAAYLRRRGHSVFYSIEGLQEKPDIIVIMDVKESSCSIAMDSLVDFKKKHNVKIVHRVNDNGSHRKFDNNRSDEKMIFINKLLADKTVFISGWLKEYYEEKGLFVKDSCVIHNGTDRGLFFSNNEVRGVDDPIKIITHHWSSNLSKGYETYNEINEFCVKNPDVATFCFLGNPNTEHFYCQNIISPKPYKEIPSYLRARDIYVTATQFESGGCHLIEGMACGLIPFVRNGGGGTEEYVDGFGINYSNSEDFINKLVALRNNYDLYLAHKKKIQEYAYGAKEMCEKYLEIFRGN